MCIRDRVDGGRRPEARGRRRDAKAGRLWDARVRRADPGSWRREAVAGRPEAGGRRPEGGGRRPEAGGRRTKPEGRRPEAWRAGKTSSGRGTSRLDVELVVQTWKAIPPGGGGVFFNRFQQLGYSNILSNIEDFHSWSPCLLVGDLNAYPLTCPVEV